MFYYNVHIRANIGFNNVALLVEVNTFFLHWRKLLQMVGTPYHNRKYLIIKYLNLASFVVFRFGACVAITTAIFFWRSKVSPTYYICICFAMFFMDILNVVLFWRLCKSDILRAGDGSKNYSPCQNIKLDCQSMNGCETVSRGESLLLGNNSFMKGETKKTD